MSAVHEDTPPEDLIELMNLTAEELARRGEALLSLSRKLLTQAMSHARLAELPAERSTGRFGVVTEAEAIKAAGELREFTVAQLAERLGLKPSSTYRWLSKLLHHDPPIIEQTGAAEYRYIDPKPAPVELRPERPRRTRRERARKIGQRIGPGGVEGTGGDLLRSVHKDLQPVVREALGEGWTLGVSGDKHFKLTRKGDRISFARTPRNGGDAASMLRQRLRSEARVLRQVSRNGHG